MLCGRCPKRELRYSTNPYLAEFSKILIICWMLTWYKECEYHRHLKKQYDPLWITFAIY